MGYFDWRNGSNKKGGDMVSWSRVVDTTFHPHSTRKILETR